MVSFQNETRQGIQLLTSIAQRGDGATGFFNEMFCPPAAFLDPEQSGVSQFTRFRILTNGFAHSRRVAGEVQEVIRDLEGQTNTFSKMIHQFDRIDISPRDSSPHRQRRS